MTINNKLRMRSHKLNSKPSYKSCVPYKKTATDSFIRNKQMQRSSSKEEDIRAKESKHHTNQESSLSKRVKASYNFVSFNLNTHNSLPRAIA
jgi:hypothetical protein